MRRNSASAYLNMAQSSQDGRELEATVLLKAANKLKECRDDWETEDGQGALTEALRYNQRLWTIFQAELCDNTNALPSDVRNNLLRLSNYVDRSTFAMMAEPKRTTLDSLIQLNHTIAEGLLDRTAQ
jgi:flagellar biosynthesis activator protein FlaF